MQAFMIEVQEGVEEIMLTALLRNLPCSLSPHSVLQHEDPVPGLHHIHKRGLHGSVASSVQQESQGVGGLEQVLQPSLYFVHDGVELGVDCAEQGLGASLADSRVGVGRPGSHEELRGNFQGPSDRARGLVLFTYRLHSLLAFVTV